MTRPSDVDEELIAAARAAREQAHCPYSGFSVGAALRCADGTIFTGVNVENASFGLTLCAERAAVVSAVTAGHRSFTAVAVVTDTDPPAMPCGACRQVLTEFAPELEVLAADMGDAVVRTTLDKLLPGRFDGP